MTASFGKFQKGVRVALDDVRLQTALRKATDHKLGLRNDRMAELPGSDAMRDHFKQIRSATLKNLAHHLETFEQNAQAAGATVHWALDAEEANQLVIDIARQHDATLVTKSKSMTTEEIELNAALIHAGIEPVETDLGEWIVQLADEKPSHIISPAIHLTRQQAAELIGKQAGRELSSPIMSKPLTAEARIILREKFLSSKVGISGANFAIAETGTVIVVENEGNGRFVTSAPKVHIAIMGIEKIAPTLDDAAVWLSLLARSATGQPFSIYTNFVTGPAKPGDADGPEEVHIILLDNGRSEQIGTKYEEVLQCIRCGACLNGCPVYQKAGGHSYAVSYPGPIGSVISPLLFGLEENAALPHACSLCLMCKDVCPARIDFAPYAGGTARG